MSTDLSPYISQTHLKTRTARELISQLREREIAMREYAARGLHTLEFLELMIYNNISREAAEIHEELDSRTSTASI